MSSWPVEIATDGNVSCGVVLWRTQRRLFMTVVVKASFSMTQGGAVVPTSPVDVAREDRMYDRHPSRSVEVASDLAPYLARCDVTFVGCAHAPGAQPAAAASVRLAIFRDARPLLDKTLHVYGDRKGSEAPAPFTRLPIVYERAYGGLGVESNPVGVESPSVVDPRDPKAPAGFGPVSRYWPARKRLLAGVDRKALEAAIAELPDSMPWGYFQAAPPDQQIEHLRGDEWIVLDGLHPRLARVQTQLAGARGAARVLARGGGEAPLDLVADTLSIDGERQQCSVVWRGRHEVAGGEAALASLSVGAGLEMAGRPVQWSRVASSARGGIAAVAAPVAAAPASAGEGTFTLKPEAHAAASSRAVAPFAVAPAGPGDEPRSGAASATPWGGGPLRPAPAPAPAGEETLAVRSAAAGESTLDVGIAAPPPPMMPPPSAAPAAPPTQRAPAAPPQAPPPSRQEAPAVVKPPPSRRVPADPEAVAARLLRAGATSDDIDALMKALRPPPPPPDDEDA